MRRISRCLLAMCMTWGGVASAQDLIIYPANGQSPEQQDKDKYECYSWAKGQSGFDPMETPKATAPPPSEPTGPSTAGRALRGAAVGGAIGQIAGNNDDARTGAAIGGMLGGMRGRSQKKQYEAERAQWEQEQAAQYQYRRSQYNRAFSACMEPRGYSVK